jgi:pimeloyl-ACP methyl ester carboxylesterase
VATVTERGSTVAKIVLVHGAFNELWGPNELKARWLPAVRDGLWHHGLEIADDDVAVCFYGDLFRRMPGTDEEQRLEQSRAGIADALADLQGGDAVAALGQAASDAAFERTVDMVTIMATEPDLRPRLRARIEAVVDPSTRVIVAHSLGTVLTYMALCHHPGWDVHTFVTLGSPLGTDMIFDSLDPPPAEGQGVWPGSVVRWVNVRAVGDKAATIALGERFGDRVEDVLVDNGHRAHAPEPYLNAAVTGSAIAAALSDAEPAP